MTARGVRVDEVQVHDAVRALADLREALQALSTARRVGALPAALEVVQAAHTRSASLVDRLLTAAELHAAGRWPADWPAPPVSVQMRGIELMPRDVWRAAQAFGSEYPQVRVEQGDMNLADFGQCNVITILDALHYFDHARQREVLTRIRQALAPNGRFITRVGDAASGLPFRLSNWVDHAVTFTRGHRLPRLYCRPLSDWKALLADVGFNVRSQAMSGRLPFANVLLVCDVRRQPAGAPVGQEAPEASEALASL